MEQTTMTRDQKLDAIIARCRELLALAEKRTPGKWKICNYRPYRVIGRDPLISTYHVGDDKFKTLALPSEPQDATFIASCACNAEAGWKATIAAIDGLREVIACFDAAECEGLHERLSDQQYELGTLRDLVERRLCFAKTEADKQLDAIITAWEGAGLWA